MVLVRFSSHRCRCNPGFWYAVKASPPMIDVLVQENNHPPTLHRVLDLDAIPQSNFCSRTDSICRYVHAPFSSSPGPPHHK